MTRAVTMCELFRSSCGDPIGSPASTFGLSGRGKGMEQRHESGFGPDWHGQLTIFRAGFGLGIDPEQEYVIAFNMQGLREAPETAARRNSAFDDQRWPLHCFD